jgi:phthalate 4,5-dioxygenase
VQECNWLQAVEGEIDSAHAPLLHGRLDAQGTTSAWIQKRDLRPTFECIKQDFGMSIAARRNYDQNTLYWRVNQFLLPFYTLVPPLSPFPDLSGHAWVPIDDENTLCIMFSYHPSQPLASKTRKIFEEGHNGRESGHASRHALLERPATVPYAAYWTKYNPQNGFQFDYESQKTTWFSGLPGLWVQDGACQSGVSPIFDRTKERLCSSDTGIAMTRRLLLETLGAYRDHGTKPKGVTEPDVFMVRAVSLRLPPEDSWVDVGAEFMRARLGADFGYDV